MLERATSQESYRKIVEDLANPAQSQIVSGDEYTNTLILAGPGAGKTKVVIHRCAYLIRVQRADPESILIVCFNHSAAVELRRKLVELIGEDAAGVTVQTYHGIAMRLTGTSFSDLMEKGTEPASSLRSSHPRGVSAARRATPIFRAWSPTPSAKGSLAGFATFSSMSTRISTKNSTILCRP